MPARIAELFCARYYFGGLGKRFIPAPYVPVLLPAAASGERGGFA
jgi:hypothetical protein